jgi:predicted HTH domain antitoxin
MTITLDIPDEIGAALAAAGQDVSRAALEAIALEGYRSDRLTSAEVRRLLGFETRMEVDEFLKRHGADMHYTLDDLENDIAVALHGTLRTHDERQRESPVKRLA